MVVGQPKGGWGFAKTFYLTKRFAKRHKNFDRKWAFIAYEMWVLRKKKRLM